MFSVVAPMEPITGYHTEHYTEPGYKSLHISQHTGHSDIVNNTKGCKQVVSSCKIAILYELDTTVPQGSPVFLTMYLTGWNSWSRNASCLSRIRYLAFLSSSLLYSRTFLQFLTFFRTPPPSTQKQWPRLTQFTNQGIYGTRLLQNSLKHAIS